MILLDEPTNDLDIETLDLLQELLADYAGYTGGTITPAAMAADMQAAWSTYDLGGQASPCGGNYFTWAVASGAASLSWYCRGCRIRSTSQLNGTEIPRPAPKKSNPRSRPGAENC